MLKAVIGTVIHETTGGQQSHKSLGTRDYEQRNTTEHLSLQEDETLREIKIFKNIHVYGEQ
jgi:hypothetical protein